MSVEAALALILATLALVAIPGPNLALFIANTLAHGFRAGAITVFGTASGIAVQLALVVFGLAALLNVAAAALVWLKWAGVVYLLYLGVTAWRKGSNPDVSSAQGGLAVQPTGAVFASRLFVQGLLLSIVNPKTLLFNVAFIPQFVPENAGLEGLLVPALVFLSVIVIGDLLWVGFARSARPLLLRLDRLRHRLTGGLFLASGFGLALARAEPG